MVLMGKGIVLGTVLPGEIENDLFDAVLAGEAAVRRESLPCTWRLILQSSIREDSRDG